eukprot:TRINITY_DN2295_c0_g1_i9.p1 TRINITY_DN2295_c0_g1~~TRINITY_DN2295_c0_g1_i9.p1  ORF type:complete len:943 (+),score=176.53 TRINITY_DN2295_c0_g1_i9:89-2917(+)
METNPVPPVSEVTIHHSDSNVGTISEPGPPLASSRASEIPREEQQHVNQTGEASPGEDVASSPIPIHAQSPQEVSSSLGSPREWDDLRGTSYPRTSFLHSPCERRKAEQASQQIAHVSGSFQDAGGIAYYVITVRHHAGQHETQKRFSDFQQLVTQLELEVVLPSSSLFQSVHEVILDRTEAFDHVLQLVTQPQLIGHPEVRRFLSLNSPALTHLPLEPAAQNSLEAASIAQSDVQECCLCPITFQVMKDPVTAEDGYTYESSAILKWLAQSGTSPITKEPMAANLVPNRAIRDILELMPAGDLESSDIGGTSSLGGFLLADYEGSIPDDLKGFKELGAQRSKTNWVPDTYAGKCQNQDCSAEFTTTRRRHHCRRCGELFCWECCSDFVEIPYEHVATLPHETPRPMYARWFSEAQAMLSTGSVVAQHYRVCRRCSQLVARRSREWEKLQGELVACSIDELWNLYEHAADAEEGSDEWKRRVAASDLITLMVDEQYNMQDVGSGCNKTVREFLWNNRESLCVSRYLVALTRCVDWTDERSEEAVRKRQTMIDLLRRSAKNTLEGHSEQGTSPQRLTKERCKRLLVSERQADVALTPRDCIRLLFMGIQCAEVTAIACSVLAQREEPRVLECIVPYLVVVWRNAWASPEVREELLRFFEHLVATDTVLCHDIYMAFEVENRCAKDEGEQECARSALQRITRKVPETMYNRLQAEGEFFKFVREQVETASTIAMRVHVIVSGHDWRAEHSPLVPYDGTILTVAEAREEFADHLQQFSDAALCNLDGTMQVVDPSQIVHSLAASVHRQLMVGNGSRSPSPGITGVCDTAGCLAAVAAKDLQDRGLLKRSKGKQIVKIAESTAAVASWLTARFQRDGSEFGCPVAPQLTCTGVDKRAAVSVKLEGASKPTVIPLRCAGTFDHRIITLIGWKMEASLIVCSTKWEMI